MKVLLRIREGDQVEFGEAQSLSADASAVIMMAMKMAGVEIAADVIAVTLIPDQEPPRYRRGIIDRTRLITALECAGWVQARAARILGLTPRQVGHSLSVHGIRGKSDAR